MTIPSLRFRAETLIRPIRVACWRFEPGSVPELWPVGRSAPSSRAGFIAHRRDWTKRNLRGRWILLLRCGYLATNKTYSRRKAKESFFVTFSPGEGAGLFQPRFDAAGLITAVAVDAASGEVLMLAHMDAEALARTRETGLAHFHSRTRGRLWLKGESSGNTLRVVETRVDCDQDAIVLRVEPAGPACHTGERSCFYRVLVDDRLVKSES